MGLQQPGQKWHQPMHVAPHLEATFTQGVRAVESSLGQSLSVAIGESNDGIRGKVIADVSDRSMGTDTEGECVRHRTRPVGELKDESNGALQIVEWWRTRGAQSVVERDQPLGAQKGGHLVTGRAARRRLRPTSWACGEFFDRATRQDRSGRPRFSPSKE